MLGTLEERVSLIRLADGHLVVAQVTGGRATTGGTPNITKGLSRFAWTVPLIRCYSIPNTMQLNTSSRLHH